MRKFTAMLAVALLASGITWWVATNRSVGTLPAAAAPEPAVNIADLAPEEQTAVRVYQNVNHGVVHITTRGVAPDDWGPFVEAREGSGSGSVIDQKGHIVTNFHVIENARRIDVLLYDGSSYEGKLVGTDPNNDLAVIQIDAPADKLVPIAWGDSNNLLAGMRVYAIGNPFGLDRTLTTGIVSSLNRSLRSENKRLIRGVIQTDAAINPGNSGGPLLNRNGAMIGITTAIIGRAGQSSGVGLAIPSNAAQRVVDELLRHGRVVRGDTGIVGVYPTDRGLLISRLDPDGSAARAGLRGPQARVVQRNGASYRVLDRSKADLIVAVDGQPTKTLDDLLGVVEAKKPGEKVTYRVIRDGKQLDVPVELAESVGT